MFIDFFPITTTTTTTAAAAAADDDDDDDRTWVAQYGARADFQRSVLGSQLEKLPPGEDRVEMQTC